MKKLGVNFTAIYVMGLAGIITSAQAEVPSASTPVEKQILRYLTNLATGNAADMKAVFTPQGYVISTTQGKKPAIVFFTNLLPQLKEEKMTLHRVYSNGKPSGWYSASFHYTFTLKDGEQRDGDYTDEFHVDSVSGKFDQVIMYENLKF